MNSDAAVFDELSKADENIAAVQQVVVAAKELAASFALLPLDGLRQAFSSVLRRVVIHDTHIQIVLNRVGLRQMLHAGKKRTSSNIEDQPSPLDELDLIYLTVEVKLRRCGGEVHLVVPPDSPANGLVKYPRPSLIKAVARAQGWYQQILRGDFPDQRSIAQHAGLTERYVGKILSCAFLAPDIVEAILEGRQPHDLTFEKLCKHVPISWVEQRMQFGFPSVSQRSL